MQRKKERIRFKHRIEYVVFAAFVWVVKVSPLALIKANCRVITFIFKKIGKRYERTVIANLKTAFPEAPQAEILQLKKRIYHHFSLVFVEIIYLFVKRRAGKILKRIVIKNLENLSKVLEKGQGVIIFSGHFGNWELVPFILNRELGRKIFSIARPMDNPLVENMVKRFREFMGSEIVYKQNSIRTILKALEKNEVVYLLIDHNTIAREAVFVDFFGKKVSAVPSVSGLHIKKGIPVVPLFLHYEEDHIVLEIMEEIRFHKTADARQDIENLTQQCTTLIEQRIRKHPEQWFWFHNRWKTQPPGQPGQKITKSLRRGQ